MHPAIEDIEDEELRRVLEQLHAAGPDDRMAAYQAARDRKTPISEADAVRVLRVALADDLPPHQFDWYDSAEQLVSMLWLSPHESLVEAAEAAYGDARENLRTPLLALVAATKSEAGARAFVRMVTDVGWPESVYQRVFWELAENGAHAAILFPTLMESGEHFVALGNALLAFLREGDLEGAALAPLQPILEDRLESALDIAEPMQRDSGSKWRFSEKYSPAKSEAGFLLDLASWVGGDRLLGLAERAAKLRDPWLLTFAGVALARHGRDATDAIHRAAAEDETRAMLWVRLDTHDMLDKFPIEWAERRHFAASDIVNWLKYPTELGQPPDELELMEIFESDDQQLYVWRFRQKGKPWTAATSGLYPVRALPGPLSGSSTFSCFERWSSKTAEEHALQVLDTLADWRRAHDERNG